MRVWRRLDDGNHLADLIGTAVVTAERQGVLKVSEAILRRPIVRESQTEMRGAIFPSGVDGGEDMRLAAPDAQVANMLSRQRGDGFVIRQGRLGGTRVDGLLGELSF